MHDKRPTHKKGKSETVRVIEVGPRDGLQFEKKILPTHLKVDLIKNLVAAGLREIQVASFVSPDIVPQMADADVLVAQLPKHDGVVYTGLVLNARGVERAAAAGLKSVEVSISASESHSLRNANMDLRTAATQASEMIRIAKEMGLTVRAGIQCAFGYPDEDDIPLDRIQRMVENFMGKGIDILCLADTTGMADPLKIESVMQQVHKVIDDVDIVLHLHDTRGLGLVNVQTALAYGVRSFDASLAGMGGCPFTEDAAGNIATEDLVNLLHRLRFQTHIDIAKVARCSLAMESFFNKRFPGRLHRLVL